MKQLESFVGSATFYGRMIPDFATKMLLLNKIRKEEFRWVKEEQNAFENIKNELCANPLVQPYSLTKEATVTTDASEKAIVGVLSQIGHPVIYISRKLSQAKQKYSCCGCSRISAEPNFAAWFSSFTPAWFFTRLLSTNTRVVTISRSVVIKDCNFNFL